MVRTARKLLAIHLLAWSQTFQVLAGAALPGARAKNRAAKVVRLVERQAQPDGATKSMRCPECFGDHGDLTHGQHLRAREIAEAVGHPERVTR